MWWIKSYLHTIYNQPVLILNSSEIEVWSPLVSPLPSNPDALVAEKELH